MTDHKVSQEFKFDVFISYRHSDLDSAVAGYLQKTLEHYHIPREIQKKCGKKKINRVFRDEEELGVASDLFNEIEQNLKQSEFLVVICSPRILESKWCLREIETFIKYRGRENILPVLIEGEPETAFPHILRENGEPLAADLRGRNKRETIRHARERMPRLVAPLLYCSYDELYQRHRVYKMHRMLTLAGLVAVVSMVFGAVTLMQGWEIKKSYQAKLENQFRYLAKTSSELLNSGDRDAALLVALEALPRSNADTSRPYVAEARIALEQALYTYEENYLYQLHPYKQLEHREEIGSIISRHTEENVLLTTDSGYIYVWDGATCDNICCRAYSGELLGAELVGNHSVAVMTGTGAFCFNYCNDEILWKWDYPVCDARENDYCLGTELIWTFDSRSNQILCANKYLCLHRAEGSGEWTVTKEHMLYLVDVGSGESRAWAPEELFGLLDGELYKTFYLEKECFALSPGGELTLLAVQAPMKQDIVLSVFPTGEDRACLAKEYTSEYLFGNAVEKASFLDDDHLAVIHILEGKPTLGQAGKSARWELECWNVDTGELRMSYQDTCLCLKNRAEVEKLTYVNGDENDVILSVTYDNVAVNLDWATGEQLARIEDRSAIALNHFFNSASELIVTEDGYLFVTHPADDMVWAPMYSAYHYYIGISRIEQSMWLDDKAFFFTANGVYCYAPALDESCTRMEAAPDDVLFTADSGCLLAACSNGRVCLYDTDDFSLLWEDEYCDSYVGLAVGLANDSLAAYLKGDGTVLMLRSFRDGSEREIVLDGTWPNLVEDWKWSLRAGGGKVLVWNGEQFFIGTYGQTEEKLASTALWLVDAETGEVSARWSFQELIHSLPGEYDVAKMRLRLENPAVTADGRYAVIPCSISAWQTDSVLYVQVWDLETRKLVQLPQEVTRGMSLQIALGTFFKQDGWLSPQGHNAVFYNSESRRLQVVDLADGTLLYEVEAEGITSQEVSFTPDGDHLIFQDSQMRICVYNWRKGECTMQDVMPQDGYMRFSFYRDGQVLSATYKAGGLTSETTMLYRRTEAGVYKLDTSISFCGGCDGKTVVINNNGSPRLYHAYTLDDLIAQAKEILNGRELTQQERRGYLID